MKLIDSHCHLTHGRLRPQLADVLGRADDAGVAAFISASGDLAESGRNASLARKHENIYFTAGVHPHDAKDTPDGYLADLEQLAGDAKNVAIGEIGLDYHYDFSPRDAQQRVFAAQLDLALRLEKTIVVHTREAFDDTMSILRDSGVDGATVEFHSFTAGPADGRTAIDFGAMIGFSGIVTFGRTDLLRQTAATVPDDRLLIETDSPYLSPEPVRRQKTNEPANVAHVAACLARVRNTTPQQLAELTTGNTARFFKIDVP